MNPVMTRIMAVVGIIIGFVFMGLLYGYNEQLYAALSAHCNINSERVITLRFPANTSTNVNLSKNSSNTDCAIAASEVSGWTYDDLDDLFPGHTFPTSGTSAEDVTFETPNGTKIVVALSITTGWTGTNAISGAALPSSVSAGDNGWETQIGLGGQFRTLTFLLIAVIPLALVAAVIAQAVPLIMNGGGSNVTDVVNKQTMGLLIAAAVIIAAPILFEQASNAQNDLVGLGSAAQFLTITNLIFDLVPLTYVIGVMGLIIYGSGLVQRFRGGQKMGGMMGM